MSHLFDLNPSQVATTTDDWYTPRWIFDAAGITFDMDVASPIDPTYQHVPAKRYLTALDDGLATPWKGTIWCNPPYSGSTPWVEKWAAHDGEGMILVILAAKGPGCAEAVARVAAADKHADGGYLIKGAA